MKRNVFIFLLSFLTLHVQNIYTETQPITKKCLSCGIELSTFELWEQYKNDKRIFLCTACQSLFRGKDDEEILGILGITTSPSASTIVTALEENALADQQEHLFNPSATMDCSEDSPLAAIFHPSVEVKRLFMNAQKKPLLLRQKKAGKERKNRKAFWASVEREAQTILNYMWEYKILNENSVKIANGPLSALFKSPDPLVELWFRGPCLITRSKKEYIFQDFSLSPKGIVFQNEEGIERYLKENKYREPFIWYCFNPKISQKLKPADGGILKTESEGTEQKKIKFPDGTLKRLITTQEKPLFHYSITDGGNALMVCNSEGYIFKCPLPEPVESLLAQGTNAIILTKAGKEIFYNFEHHRYNQPFFEGESPLATLEAPAQNEEHFTQQGFLKMNLTEKSREALFRETAPVPPGYTYAVHPPLTREALIEWLKQSKRHQKKEQGCLPFFKKKDSLEVLLSPQDSVEVALPDEDDDDVYKIALMSNFDQAWKRGSEVLVTEQANRDLILYNFERGHVDRFDTTEIPVLNDLEKEFLSLGFKKPPFKE